MFPQRWLSRSCDREVVEQPLGLGLAAPQPVHQQINAYRVWQPFSPLEEFDFAVIRGLFRWHFEFVLSFEVVVFQERHHGIGIFGGDDEIQIGREARLELRDGVATDENEVNSGALEIPEYIDESLASFFLAHEEAGVV